MTTRRMRRSRHSSAEGTTDLNSGDNFPHAPFHLHIDDNDKKKAELLPNHSDGTNADTDNRGLVGDRGSIALLLFLYVLQGIPLGLAGSIPLLLQSRKVSYKDQALFSFVYWPFSVKLLWAPIVDSAYFPAFGRRKTWLVPTQYLIGLFMLVLSGHIPELMGEGGGGAGEGKVEAGPVNVYVLTAVFFMLNFLAATQDIAVDGWALTMLSRRNVGWESTCNTVGQTAGYFLGNVLFLALESPEFCNAYLRSSPEKFGLVTLGGFTYFWGIVFFITTTIVWITKHERNELDGDDMGIIDAYRQLIKVIRLPAVLKYLAIALTCKIGFAAADAVTGLKLVEEGVPKEKLALLAVPLVPIQIMLPLLISRYTAGPNPLNVWIKAYPPRIFMGLLFMLVVYYTPSFRLASGDFPFYYYVLLVVCYGFHQIALYCMFVSIMAFHAKISDPTIGGTYMTLLNTVTNLGGNWPSTLALWFVDALTWRRCENGPGVCDTMPQQDACKEGGGTCVTTLDGYYIESGICAVIGVLWLLWQHKRIRRIQALSPSAWKCS